jgi:hypothetical protein
LGEQSNKLEMQLHSHIFPKLTDRVRGQRETLLEQTVPDENEMAKPACVLRTLGRNPKTQKGNDVSF